MTTSLSHTDLISIAEKYGTPLYVYHAEKIKEQYGKLQAAFGNTNTIFFYACKALTNVNILRYIRNLGANVDCSSINEVKLALHAGFLPIAFSILPTELILKKSGKRRTWACISILTACPIWRNSGQHFGYSYPVGIRLRPNILAGGNLKNLYRSR